MAQTIDFVSLLHKSQEYISENYAAALSDRSKIVQLRSYIEKYLHDSGFEVEGMTFRELADKLYAYYPVLCTVTIAAVRCLIRRTTTKAVNPIIRSDAAATGIEP